jgi:hypothetical protein
MALNEYEQERRLLIDITTPARSIEHVIGHMLFSTRAGLYLPASAEPIICEDRVYFQYNEKTDEMKPFSGADLIFDRSLIEGDIYNEKQLLLLQRKKLQFLTTAPTIPVRAIGIILDLINSHLVQHFAFNRGAADAAENALDDLVLNEFSDQISDMATFIHDIHSPNRALITDFMGDDHYKRHLVRLVGESAMIVKQNDIRILRFNELLSEGEIDAPKKVWDHTF